MTARTRQRLFGVFGFFNHYAHSKGFFLVFSGDILSRLVKPWMREEKSVNREILLEENTGHEASVAGQTGFFPFHARL